MAFKDELGNRMKSERNIRQQSVSTFRKRDLDCDVTVVSDGKLSFYI